MLTMSGFESNPYQSPVLFPSTAQPVLGASAPAGTDKTAAILKETRPWVRFVSIVGFVFSALMIFGGIAGGIFLTAIVKPTEFQGSVLFIYAAFGLLYLVPSIYLFQYASNIGAFLRIRSARSLDIALESQKSFWKFMGILFAIVLCLYALLIVGAIVFGIAGAALMRR
jgi:hypothetical protein